MDKMGCIFLHFIALIVFANIVVCVPPQYRRYKVAPRSQVRLVDGRGPHEGHVQVKLFEEWKYICPNHWDMRDAKVVCRQLHYSKAVKATSRAWRSLAVEDNKTLFTLKGRYWLDAVQCWGSEPDINFCWHRKYGRHNCLDPNDVAGVVCSNVTEAEVRFPVPSPDSGADGAKMEVRLRGPVKHGFISSGLLEVKYGGLWRYVCADGWTRTASFVACGHLGYPDVDMESNSTPVQQHPDVSEFWMNDVRCRGTESTLYECRHAGWRRHVCRTSRAVHLKCTRSPLLIGNRFDKALIAEQYARVRAGSKHSEGRVEVKYKNRWGSICDDGWDIKAANVFCRMVGFGSAFEAVHYALFGQGMGKVWLDQIKCTGRERNITECKHLPWGEGSCGHLEDAGVKCHYPYAPPVKRVRVVGGPNEMEGRVEVHAHGAWQGVCGIGFGLTEAQVVCREAGLGYPARGFPAQKYGINKKFAMYTVRCSGDELALHHCFYNKRVKVVCDWMAAVTCSKTAPDLVTDYREVKKSMNLQSKTLFTLQCAFEEGCLAPDASNYISHPRYYYRTLLRFTSRMYNRGTEDFKPNVNQDRWQWHTCHQHYHSMERFSDYDITDSHGIRRSTGHKASFCLEDSICDRGTQRRYNCSNDGEQGISVNCADNYKWDIDCQWIDVTTLAKGAYQLRIVLNPLRQVFESDYSNNVVRCNFTYVSEKRVDVGDCHIDTCEQMSHGGTGGGACCKFPFTYRGNEYRSCTTAGFKDHSVLWCATTSDYDNDKRWGHCRDVKIEEQNTW